MNVKLTSPENALALAKRMVFLAYNAAGGASGMGIFQATRLGGQAPDEETVWKCAYNAEDYNGNKHTKKNEIYCDYVFGSMMKWGCSWDFCEVNIVDKIFRPDYQGFCKTYPSNLALVNASLESLDIEGIITL